MGAVDRIKPIGSRIIASADSILCWLRRSVALAALVLVAATWRLWTPQTVYPQIPLLAWAGAIPVAVEWLAAAVLVGAFAMAGVAPQSGYRGRVGLAAASAALVVLMLIDQHRAQPWAYEFLLLGLIVALSRPRRGVVLCRWLVASIYLYSGLSKLDATFLETHGRQLLFGTLAQFGWQPRFWSETALSAAAAVLPVGELLVAVGLCVPMLRRPAVVGSGLMHVGLLVALGPWGLNHRPAVLLWNVYFLAQNVILFWPRLSADDSPSAAAPSRAERCGDVTAVLIAAAAILLPLLEPWSRFDHWPAWAVYASRPERVAVLIDADAAGRLPPELQTLLAPPRWADGRRRVRIDEWSLATLDVPIYPQDRFRLGVALALARRYALGDAIHLEIESAADRWTGRRTRHTLDGTAAIARAAAAFRLNAQPRH